MSTKTDIIINSFNADNKKTSDTISYVNPDISNNVALELAQRINSLTDNTYSSTERVDRTELGTIKPARLGTFTANAYVDGATVNDTDITDLAEFTMDVTKCATVKNNTRHTFNINFNASGVNKGTKLYPAFLTSDADNFTPNYSATWASSDSYSTGFVFTCALHQKIAQDITLTLHIPETEDYAALEKTWTIHFIDPQEG